MGKIKGMTTAEIQAALEDSACRTLKAHRTTDHTSITANAWTDCDTFTVVASETQGEAFELNADGKTFDVLMSGMIAFGGCIHIENNTTGGFTSIQVLMRLLKNGTDEMRCSERGFTEEVRAGGEDVLSYNGTGSVAVGDTIKLQYYTDNAAVDFFSNAAFDSRVAYTLWLTRMASLIS